MTTITFSLVSHTNAGKTTLARTLLSREIGEVRDAPHVTEFATEHELIASSAGDSLRLWDTPGFGDSARLVKRLRGADSPVGWLLAQVWDRWRDRAFWAGQQALRHVQAHSDVVLYLVNAAEPPAAAGYVAPEMELLAWLDKPVLVLVNQLGAPRAPAEEAADVRAWRDHLARWPRVRAVLPLDAFARCWVHELTLLRAAQEVLQGEAAAAMARLAEAWLARRVATFDEAMQLLAQGLVRCAAAREPVLEAAGVVDRLRRLGAVLTGRDEADPAVIAQRRLTDLAQAVAREGTAQLLQLHGLQGQVPDEILGRVATQIALREKLPEGRAAVLGGAVTGALTGLKADVLSGGLTLGGGMLAGGLIGALGAAGLARGINVLRDTGHSWVAFSDDALAAQVQAALLRYLAVAHFGRGRGDWAQGEAPPHWPQAVADALAPHADAIAHAWTLAREQRDGARVCEQALAALQAVLADAMRAVLAQLYPEAAAVLPARDEGEHP